MMRIMWGPGDILLNEIDLVPVLTDLLPSRGEQHVSQYRNEGWWCWELGEHHGQALSSVAFVFLRMPDERLIHAEWIIKNWAKLSSISSKLSPTWWSACQESYPQTLAVVWITWTARRENEWSKFSPVISFSSTKHQPGCAAAKFSWDLAGVPHGDDPGTMAPSHLVVSLRALDHPQIRITDQ